MCAFLFLFFLLNELYWCETFNVLPKHETCTSLSALSLSFVHVKSVHDFSLHHEYPATRHNVCFSRFLRANLWGEFSGIAFREDKLILREPELKDKESLNLRATKMYRHSQLFTKRTEKGKSGSLTWNIFVSLAFCTIC